MAERIVIFRVGQLGDTLSALPAIWAIREGFPAARLSLISDRHPGSGYVSSWEILGPTRLFDDVMWYVPARRGTAGRLQALALAFKVRRRAPDALFHLAPFPRRGSQVKRDRFFYERLCGVSRCYGLGATDHLYQKHDDQGRLIRLPSEVDRYLAIAAEAGIPVPRPENVRFRVPIGAAERSRVDGLWAGENLGGARAVVAFGTGGKQSTQRWPQDRFTAVARRLLADVPGSRIVFLGGEEDRARARAICDAVGDGAITWAGALSVLESAELLRRCHLYVGNDTGTLHLAAAVGTRCVGIFSARNHAGMWHPYGLGHAVLRRDVPCAGCYLNDCDEKGLVCLLGISADEVVSACLDSLER